MCVCEGGEGWGSACIENSRRICPQIFRVASLTHIVGLRSVTIVCLSVFPHFSIINDYFLCNEIIKTKKKEVGETPLGSGRVSKQGPTKGGVTVPLIFTQQSLKEDLISSAITF